MNPSSFLYFDVTIIQRRLRLYAGTDYPFYIGYKCLWNSEQILFSFVSATLILYHKILLRDKAFSRNRIITWVKIRIVTEKISR